ncbi:MAG TPA: MBL fold metallo-hydrolase [Tepidisphaeraceae bacterium]|jgi:glyoxylase-like metal-dependent hydrolase (beta-lactamase superfamily II)|nr:MBL fold metallo-hydrolase [Tepidisphaeraceae bacterium]
MTSTSPSTSITPFASANPHYSWKLLRAGPLRLDGGSMFGLVPKVLWSKSAPTDEQGRITLAHNCLLLERRHDDINLSDGAVDNGPHRVLIEAGSGDKFDAKNRAIFGLSDESVLSAALRAGVSAADIDDIIVTHLHFDHCGGLTRKSRPGEKPDWSPGGANATSPGVNLTFPNAPVFVQRQEWDDALANRSVMTRTYLRENLEPLRDRVKLLDGPPPWPVGHRPEKDEAPAATLADMKIDVFPGISVFRVPGHTWGQQAVSFTDDFGRTVVFTPDLIPTIHHAGAAYNMAYDVEPYISTVTRRWFLEEAMRGDWLLVLDHEPGNPCCRVREDGKGWYELVADAL